MYGPEQREQSLNSHYYRTGGGKLGHPGRAKTPAPYAYPFAIPEDASFQERAVQELAQDVTRNLPNRVSSCHADVSRLSVHADSIHRPGIVSGSFRAPYPIY